jgi:hypothetical protein
MAVPERYKKKGFTKVGAKKKSTRPGKKWMVLAKKVISIRSFMVVTVR